MLVPGRLFENEHLLDHLQYRAKQIKTSLTTTFNG